MAGGERLQEMEKAYNPEFFKAHQRLIELDKEVATSRDTLEQRQAEIKERQSQLVRSQETGARLEVLLLRDLLSISSGFFRGLCAREHACGRWGMRERLCAARRTHAQSRARR